jgi:hypothetical protein
MAVCCVRSGRQGGGGKIIAQQASPEAAGRGCGAVWECVEKASEAVAPVCPCWRSPRRASGCLTVRAGGQNPPRWRFGRQSCFMQPTEAFADVRAAVVQGREWPWACRLEP